MATHQVSAAKDLRECPVCLDDMLNKTPKILECKHSFCLPCVSGLAVAHGATALKVPCPKCKHNTVVNSGRLSDLPDNFLLQEVKAVLEDHSRYQFCVYCNKLEKETKAVTLCTNCRRFMCKDCTVKHKELFPEHEILNLVEAKQQEYCAKHQEVVIRICLACSPARLLCDICIMLDDPCHPRADFVEYNTALSNAESELRLKLDQVGKTENSLLELKQIVRSKQLSIKETAKRFKETIDKAAEEISLKTEKSNSLASLTATVDTVKQLSRNAEDLLRSGNRRFEDIRKSASQVSTALGSFDKEKKEIKSFNLDLPAEFNRVLFEALPLQSITQPDHVKGRPNLVNRLSTDGAVSKLRGSKEGRVMYVCNSSTRITELSLDGNSRQIETYEKRNKRISFDSLDHHIFIICCIRGMWTLTTAEMPSDFTKSVSTLTPLKNLCKWFTWDIIELCVIDPENIMFVRPNGNLHKYIKSCGKVIHFNIPYKDHVIKLTRVNTAEQTGVIATYESTKAVVLYDWEGNVLQIISKDGSPVKQPRATTVSRQGTILVADFETGKIIELTMKGEFVRDLLTREDGLNTPVNVAFSPPYLWVADQEEGGENFLKCFRL